MLLALVKKTDITTSMIYEGILQLLCRASISFSDELKALLERKIQDIEPESFVQSRILVNFACKLILKLPLSPDTSKKLVTQLMKYVFSKGFLKKNLNGLLYQGMSLNIYMLILSCMNAG